MFKLYQFEISPFCDKVRRILNYKGIAYEVEDFGLLQALTGAVKRVNKRGKLPVLRHNDTLVADSTEIALYLEEIEPTPALLPKDAGERARVLLMEDWADEILYFHEMYYRFTIPANRARVVPRMLKFDPALLRPLFALMIPGSLRPILRAQGLGRLPPEQIRENTEEFCANLDTLCANTGWLVGNQLTLADISVFAQLSCIAETPEGQAMITPKKNLTDWMSRVDKATPAKT